MIVWSYLLVGVALPIITKGEFPPYLWGVRNDLTLSHPHGIVDV